MVKPGPPVKGRVPTTADLEAALEAALETTGIAQILALAPPPNRGNTPLPPDPAPRAASPCRKVRLHG